MSKEELENKKYCKWHNYWSHNIADCIVFKKNIQETIRQGKIKFAVEKGKSPMEMDVDLIPLMTGMVSTKIKGKRPQRPNLCARCK